MYTLIIYDGDHIIETNEINDVPAVAGNSVQSPTFSKSGIKKEFIIIEGEFDGELDVSKDVSAELQSEEQRLQDRLNSAESTIESLMAEVAMLRGGA